jgi:hypothetical protein
MADTHAIKPLTPETFPAWLALAEKHNGVLGGCYCSYLGGDAAIARVVSFPNELTPTFERHIGKSKTVMRKTIATASWTGVPR